MDVVRVLRNKKTQKSTGCGFVAFKQAVADEAVDKAIALGKAEHKAKTGEDSPAPEDSDSDRAVLEEKELPEWCGYSDS